MRSGGILNNGYKQFNIGLVRSCKEEREKRDLEISKELIQENKATKRNTLLLILKALHGAQHKKIKDLRKPLL